MSEQSPPFPENLKPDERRLLERLIDALIRNRLRAALRKLFPKLFPDLEPDEGLTHADRCRKNEGRRG